MYAGPPPDRQKRIYIPKETPIKTPARTLPPKKTPTKEPERPLVPA